MRFTEEWKDIKGYEGLYQISNLGRVKSLPRNGTKKEEKILKQHLDRYGYAYVGLRNKILKKHKVHRLVGNAFINNPNNMPQINHKNENKSCNIVSNLEWCDNKYNVNYGTRTQKTYKKVVQYDKENNFIKEWKSIILASKELKIDNSLITKCCKGKRRTAGGYIWRYANE